MIFRACNIAALTLSSTVAVAAPSVTGNLISWPDDGWYQVQQVTDKGIIEACQGGRSCEVSPGEYIVINHSTRERFNNIVVYDSATTTTPVSTTSPIAVSGSTVSWPDDGWYQVLDESNYREVCAGGRSCELAPGSYLVVNHSSGVRFDGIVVGGAVGGDSGSVTSVEVSGNTINWPDDGWYQVLDQITYSQVCGGTRSCDVTTGLYTVINHSTGMRWEDINVGQSMASQTQVHFDITVPVYQSNELQVKLVWFDKELSANWNSDELWTAVDDFPSNSQSLLTVTFYDRNGGIALGRVEQTLNTNTNASMVYEITADRFDTSLDEDNDGVTNINELISGTDPLVADTRELPIRDKVTGGLGVNSTVISSFESVASVPRPYSVNEVRPVGSIRLSPTGSDARIIEIDEAGNGSTFYTYQFTTDSFSFLEERTGTRTNTGDSIVWVGSDYSFGTTHDFARHIHFNAEAWRVDAENTRLVVTYDLEWLHPSKTGQFISQTYDLIVKKFPNKRHCVPERGTFSSTSINPPPRDTYTSIYTKNVGDTYWHVLFQTNGTTTDEYLVPWFDMELFCNYQDLD